MLHQLITVKFVLFYSNWFTTEDLDNLCDQFGTMRWKLVTVVVKASRAMWESIGATVTAEGKLNQSFYVWFRNSACAPFMIDLVSSSGWPKAQGIEEDVINPTELETAAMFDRARGRLERQFVMQARHNAEARRVQQDAKRH